MCFFLSRYVFLCRLLVCTAHSFLCAFPALFYSCLHAKCAHNFHFLSLSQGFRQHHLFSALSVTLSFYKAALLLCSVWTAHPLVTTSHFLCFASLQGWSLWLARSCLCFPFCSLFFIFSVESFWLKLHSSISHSINHCWIVLNFFFCSLAFLSVVFYFSFFPCLYSQNYIMNSSKLIRTLHCRSTCISRCNTLMCARISIDHHFLHGLMWDLDF